MNTKLIAGMLSGLATLAIADGAAASTSGPSQAQLDRATNDGQDWLYVDHDYHGTRYTPADKINRSNVSKLAPVCSYTFPDKEPSQTGPVVYNGVLYATTAHYTVSLDGATCKVIWQSRSGSRRTTRRSIPSVARRSRTASWCAAQRTAG